MPTLKRKLLERRDSLPTTTKGGFFNHFEGTVGLGCRKARSEQLITDEDGTILRDTVHIRERSGGFFQSLLHKNSPKLDPNHQRPTATSAVDAFALG